MYSRWNFQYRMGGVKSHINWNAWAHYTRNLPWCPHHEILTILSSHFAKPTDQSVPTNRGALTPQVWFQWGCLCVYIYIYVCVAYVCYVRFHAQQIAVQKQLCHPMSQLRLFWLCRFENIWRSMCLERFLTLWMATSRFFGTFRTHWLGIALGIAERQKHRLSWP